MAFLGSIGRISLTRLGSCRPCGLGWLLQSLPPAECSLPLRPTSGDQLLRPGDILATSRCPHQRSFTSYGLVQHMVAKSSNVEGCLPPAAHPRPRRDFVKCLASLALQHRWVVVNSVNALSCQYDSQCCDCVEYSLTDSKRGRACTIDSDDA